MSVTARSSPPSTHTAIAVKAAAAAAAATRPPAVRPCDLCHMNVSQLFGLSSCAVNDLDTTFFVTETTEQQQRNVFAAHFVLVVEKRASLLRDTWFAFV